MLTASAMAGMEMFQFLMLMREQISLADLASGLIKAVFFGGAIAVVSCHFGLRASGGSVGVGRAVNASVVGSAIGIVVLDYLLTWVLK